MAHIKEPKGVDFIIQSEPLTEKARQETSEFIRNYKLKSSRKKTGAGATMEKRQKSIQS